ncbi:MAG: phosphoadenosine phosphosulfate reductase [Pseudomonadota bacterium]
MAAANDDIESAGGAEALLDGLKAEIGPEGFQHLLDARHAVSHLARGRKLMVSFERIQDTLEESDEGTPLSLDFAEDKNWSALHFTAEGNTWFRSQAVYAFIDDLIDDGFFEQFDQILFYGANMGGYAAAAFSVAAPGARVLAIAPQATLDHARTEWEDRFPKARQLDFTRRYGYGPDMVEAAAHAHILYDPHQWQDAVHASLFYATNITRLRCRFLGNRIARCLREMDLLHQIVEAAGEGRLTEQTFFRLMRRRRDHDLYLRNLLFHLDDQQRPYLTALYCAHVLGRINAPVFRRRLNASRALLAEQGAVPQWLEHTS